MTSRTHRRAVAAALAVAVLIAVLSPSIRHPMAVDAEGEGTPTILIPADGEPDAGGFAAPPPTEEASALSPTAAPTALSPTAAPTATELPAPLDTPEPVETPAPFDPPIPPGIADPTDTPAAADAAPASTASALVDAPAVPAGAEPASIAATGITPDHAGTGDPGASVAYSHLVTNLGNQTGVFDLTVGSSSGWAVGLTAADGTTPLHDHDGDGRLDTGSLAPGGSFPIVVAVVVPLDAPAGAVDVTTVTASPADQPGAGAAAGDVTTVTPVLVLTAAPTGLAFGLVAADGALDPSGPGPVSAADETGAWYEIAEAIRVTVASNAPWTGACSAAENTGSATTVTIAGGRLEWRLAGTEAWTPFAVTGASLPGTAGCFPVAELGTTTFVYDVRLRIEVTDPPGTFSTRVTFAAAP